MTTFITIFMFIIGTIFGSFFTVVGERLPKGESIISPPSHCPNCNHKLKPYELIPIISYIIQKGRCTKCHKKISPLCLLIEIFTGLLFALTYLSFGLNTNLIIPLTFISMLIIICVSDMQYLIISDEVLIFFGIVLFIEIIIINGLTSGLYALLHGILSFITMYLIKKFGDLIFKKESMGGGDIKLMFIFGMVLTYQTSVLSIFVGSLIGLPISLIILYKKKDHIIPFGPFLALGAIVLLLLHINLDTIINLYRR